MPLATLNEWFYMKDDRSSFLPRIPQDAKLVFCHRQLIQGNIIRSIENQVALYLCVPNRPHRNGELAEGDSAQERAAKPKLRRTQSAT
jgi:hypothetical protein